MSVVIFMSVLFAVFAVLTNLKEAVAGEGGKRLREINPCVAMVLSDKDMRSGTAVREKTIMSAGERETHHNNPFKTCNAKPFLLSSEHVMRFNRG